MSPLPEPQSGDLSGWRPRSALLGSLLANRYRITSFIGQGSTGAVFRADDGALRIQGKNLRGAWCDEIGLWVRWDQAWNESLA